MSRLVTTKEQVGKFAEFMTAPPVQEGYEVAVQG